MRSLQQSIETLAMRSHFGRYPCVTVMTTSLAASTWIDTHTEFARMTVSFIPPPLFLCNLCSSFHAIQHGQEVCSRRLESSSRQDPEAMSWWGGGGKGAKGGKGGGKAAEEQNSADRGGWAYSAYYREKAKVAQYEAERKEQQDKQREDSLLDKVRNTVAETLMTGSSGQRETA